MQQNLWLRAARTWLQRRWLLCLFSLALLLLLGTAVLRSGAQEAYQSRESGRLPILASAGCAVSDCTVLLTRLGHEAHASSRSAPHLMIEEVAQVRTASLGGVHDAGTLQMLTPE